MSTRAIVVFLGAESVNGAAWYAQLLKSGFVHCFVLVEVSDNPATWIKIEGKNGIVKLLLTIGEFEDIIAYYRAEGATVVATTREESLTFRTPLIVGSCVGMIKAFINSSSWAITPFGFYKYLQRYNK